MIGSASASVLTWTPMGCADLHLAHLRSVPFENLDIHLDAPIVLEPGALLDKIVRRGRGGYCYELNGAFALLLRELGFAATLLEARVLDGDGNPGIRFDHLLLRVDLDEPYLADVGFGDHFLEPLRLQPGVEQTDPAGPFRIIETDDGWFDLLRDGTPQYRFSLEPRSLGDFEPGNVHQQTSPDSHFRQGPVATLTTPEGRITLAGSTLIETREGRRTETEVGDEELPTVYRERFGIELDRLPRVTPGWR